MHQTRLWDSTPLGVKRREDKKKEEKRPSNAFSKPLSPVRLRVTTLPRYTTGLFYTTTLSTSLIGTEVHLTGVFAPLEMLPVSASCVLFFLGLFVLCPLGLCVPPQVRRFFFFSSPLLQLGRSGSSNGCSEVAPPILSCPIPSHLSSTPPPLLLLVVHIHTYPALLDRRRGQGTPPSA